MFLKDLELLIKKLRYDGFSQEESLKLVYFFKAWEILSKDKIDNEKFKFKSSDEIYNRKFQFRNSIEELDIAKLQEIFQKLSDKFYLFEAFNNDIKIDKLSEKSLI